MYCNLKNIFLKSLWGYGSIWEMLWFGAVFFNLSRQLLAQWAYLKIKGEHLYMLGSKYLRQFELFIRFYLDDKLKDDEIDGVRNMNVREEKCMNNIGHKTWRK
jgi:hypothetical protein